MDTAENIVESLLTKNLGDYGAIVWTGHGDALDKDGANKGFGDVLLFTDSGLDINFVNKHRQDFIDRNLGVSAQYGQQLLVSDVCLRPGFITAHSTSKGSNAIVYLGTCNSDNNPSMTAAFKSIGAATVFGYTRVVNDTWAKEHGVALFKGLSTGRVTEVVPGIDDTQISFGRAEFTLTGKENLVLTNAANYPTSAP